AVPLNTLKENFSMTQATPPAGFNSLSPHLVVKDADAAIDFYKRAFGAVECCRLEIPGTGKIMHASVSIGNSTLMLCEEFGEGECHKAQSPVTLGGTPVTIH